MTEGAVRLRLLFEDERILSDHQRSNGLDRCWIVLHPQIATVSDLVSHLTRSFSLHSSCPDGLLLSMDDFILPTFVSTNVFKDRDLVRVWKKGVVTRDVIETGKNTLLIEDADVVEKQPILLCDRHLAIKDSGKEIAEGLLEEKEEVDGEARESNLRDLKNSSSKVLNRKRKRLVIKKNKKACRKLSCLGVADLFHTRKHRSKKIKFRKSESNEITFVDGNENVSSDANNVEKNLCRTDKLPDDDRGVEVAISSSIKKNDTLTNVANATLNRSDSMQEKSQHNHVEPQGTSGLKKFPSRSARRKKVKRMALRELASSGTKKTNLSEMISSQSNSKDQETTVSAVKENEFIPIVVKPGHIRFEPTDEDREIVQATEVQGAFEWNGTLDKKKGQKWGREKILTNQRTGKVISGEEYTAKDNAQGGDREGMANPVDFEELCPLMRLPKVGDVVAYRLVELTSSWCPEISTFRVGKVTLFDPMTMNSVLVPFPGYPIPADKGDEESDMQLDNSLYKEDGSLEIDFSSLLDVRLFKNGNSDAGTATSKVETETKTGCASNFASSERADLILDNVAPPPTGKDITSWDEISEVLNKKKADLLKDGDSTSKNAPAPSVKEDTMKKPSRHYRALRGSALGPIVSLLRASNQL